MAKPYNSILSVSIGTMSLNDPFYGTFPTVHKRVLWFTWRMKGDLRRRKPSSLYYLIDKCVNIDNLTVWWYWKPKKQFLTLPFNLQHLTHKDNLGLKRTIKYWDRDRIQKMRRMTIDKMPFFFCDEFKPYSE